MEIKKLAKNTVILASPNVVAFFVGILKSKMIAILLGTSGFGIIDQLTQSINFIRQSTLSFLPDGMVKLIAKERAGNYDKNEIGSIIKTYFIMILPLIILVLALAFIFIDELTLFVLGDLKYKKYLTITLVALPVTIISASVGSLLKAFKEIKAIAMKQVYWLVINFTIFIPLIYFYGLEGGVYSVTLAFLTTLTLNLIMVKKYVFNKYQLSTKLILEAVFKIPYFKELLTFISVGIISGLFRVIENMSSRAIVVNELGIDQIGVYAPITKWQGLFIGFILPSVFTYLYPRLSEAKDNVEVTNVVNDVIRFITYLILPFIVIGITTRNWIIPLFYSMEFIDAAKYLPFHFSFLLMFVWARIFEQLFASRNRLKSLMLITIIVNSLSLFFVYFFVPKIGLYGYMLRFTLTPFILFVTYFIFWRRDIEFRLKGENLRIVLYSLSVVIILVLLRNQHDLLQLAVGVILILIMIPLMKTEERQFFLKRLNKILKIKK